MIGATGYVQNEPGKPLEEIAYQISPSAEEAVVEIAGCGVCHTDLGFLDGSVNPRGGRPLVPGHEVSGTVVWATGQHEPMLGRQVVVPAVWPCNDCHLCRIGRPNACTHQRMPGNDVRGGFATHIAVPAWCLAPLPVALPSHELAEMAVIADAVSTPYEAAHRAAVGPGDLVVVVGAGGVGGFLVQIARAEGASVLALDVDDDRLALASAHGAHGTLSVKDRTEREVRAAVRTMVDELRLPKVAWKIFETSGTTSGQRVAYELLNPAATLVVVGYCRERIELRLSSLMAFDATAIGVWGCRPQLYPQAIELVSAGKVVLGPYVELRPMSRVNDVVEQAHKRLLQRRVILVPDSRDRQTPIPRCSPAETEREP